MTHLFIGICDLYLRRATATANHPSRRTAVYWSVLVAIVIATSAFSWKSYADGRSAGGASEINLGMSLIFTVVLSGLVVFASEGARDKSDQMQRALSVLPLGKRRIQALVTLPLVLLALVAMLFVLVPTVLGMVGNGLSWSSSVGYAVSAALLGSGSALFAVGLFVCLMKSRRWDPVRLPFSMMLWLCFLGSATYATVDASHGLHAWHGYFAVPQLLHDISLHVPLGAEAFTVPAASFILGGAVAIIGMASGTSEPSHRPLRLVWGPPTDRSQLLADAIYAARDANVVSTVAASAGFGWVLAFAWRLWAPAPLRMNTVLAVAGVGLIAGLGARVLRGVYPARMPQHALIGIRPGRWYSSQALLALICFGLLALPAPALLDLIPSDKWPEAASVLIACCAVGYAANFLLVVSSANPMGQVVATWVYAGMGAAAIWVVTQAFSGPAPLLGLVFAAAVLVVAFAIGYLVEVRRWRPT